MIDRKSYITGWTANQENEKTVGAGKDMSNHPAIVNTIKANCIFYLLLVD